MSACRAVLLLSFLLTMAITSAAAQDLYSVETRPPRGFMPNMDQLSSPVDDIEAVSGKLHLAISLASLPAGRGGSGFDLNLVYDAHLYDIFPTVLEPQPPYEYMGPMPAYELWSQGATGGWHYNFENYKIDLEVRSDAVYNPNNCPATYSARIFRTRIGLADGSLHTMYLKGYETLPDNNAAHDGFFGVDLTGRAGFCGNWQNLTGWQTYYSNDGSHLRFEILADASGLLSNQPWYLYFPDGRRLAGHGLKVEALYDANGNGIYFSSECYDPPPSGDCSLPYQTIRDEVGREIKLDYNITDLPFGSSGKVDRITTQGPNGQISWTVNWETLVIGQTPRTYYWSNAPWWPEYQLYLNTNVVKYVQLPLAPAVSVNETPPPVWNSYAFGYSDDSDGGFGEVDSVRLPTGAEYRYRYIGEGSGSGANWEFIAHNNAVRERRITATGSPDLVWTYTGGFPFASFRQITGPDQAQTVYHFSGIPNSYLENPSAPSQGVARLVYKIDEPNGRVTKRVWGQSRLPGFYWNTHSSNFYVKRETETISNSVGSPTLTIVSERTIDKNGNQLQNTEYDWVGHDPSGPEVGSNVKRVTQNTYYAEVPEASSTSDHPEAYWNPQFNGLARRLDAVRRTEVRDGSENIAAITEFEYDDPLGKGNLTATKRWDNVKSPSPPGIGQLSSANSQVQRRGYDTNGHGNVTDIYDPPVTANGPEIQTHITYDSTDSFPERIDYAYQTSVQRSWIYHWKVEPGTSRTLPYLEWKRDDNNNITTSFSYDDVGRQTVVNEGGLRQTITEYNDSDRKVTVLKDLATLNDRKLESNTTYDQLGRVAFVWTKEPNSDGINVKTTHYPTLNRTVVSSPYRTTGDATLEWTCTQKDALQRVTAVAVFKGPTEPTDCQATANRTGITTTVHDANWTWITDPALKARGEARDPLGRLVQVKEDPGALDYDTVYAYDGLGNLTQVSQGDQPPRTFQYSSLGRLLSAWNPESGSTDYTYNDAGGLLTRTDARGVVATFSYDDMHRIRTKTYSNDPQLTPSVTYNYYTSGAPNVGHLQSVISSAATTTYTNYDDLGRVRGSTHEISGYPTPQSFAYNYWLNDGIQSIQYPSGRVVNYDVDDAGRINKVRDAQTTFADLTNIASPFSAYTADGRISAMRLGNELWETRDYRTPGTATKYKVGTALGDNQLLELEYNFSGDANNGNLVSHVIRNNRFEPVRTWSQKYSYDALNRIACVAEAANLPADPCTDGDWRQVFGYDRYGNRWVSSAPGLTGTDVHEPTAGTNFDPNTNQLILQGSQYDPSGNQTVYTPYTLAYDAENRNVSVTSPSNGGGTFAYDGEGNRVRKTWTNSSGTTTTYYFRNALGQLAVEYSSESSPNPGRVYVHTDMLGSTRLITGDKPVNWPSSTASIIECYDYVPFGRMLNSGDSLRNTGCYPSNPDYEISSRLPHKFTGKERDPETRLDYFGARYLSAAQGRFSSIDPGPFTLADPQSWNRYAYVQNNPLKFTDPTGEELELTGMFADDLTDELEDLTGWQLTRDARTGKVTIDRGTKRNKNVGSKNFAKQLEKIIKDKKHNVAIRVEQNQPMVFGDSFLTREVDFADYTAIQATNPEFAAAIMGHVFGEYYNASKSGHIIGMAGFATAHDAGLDLEKKVLSDFLGRKQQTRVSVGTAPGTWRFIYSSVTYDVLLKAGVGGSADVDRVIRIRNRKPGVP